MKIILIEDVQNLGYKDDVVEVKNGYARNFLLPTKKAILATESALKQLAEKQKQQAQKMAKIKADAEALAEAVKAAGALEFAVKASEEGKIYGSVSNAQVAEALAAKGANVEKKQIVLDNIKVLGEYVAVAKLHREVSVEIPVKVVAEEAAAE
jgi:large subunit ribosomal protein L9